MHLLAWLPLAAFGCDWLWNYPENRAAFRVSLSNGNILPLLQSPVLPRTSTAEHLQLLRVVHDELRRSHQDPGMISWMVYGTLRLESILQFPCDFLLGGPATDTRREMHVHLEAGETASESRRKPFMASQRAHQSYDTYDTYDFSPPTAIILYP